MSKQEYGSETDEALVEMVRGTAVGDLRAFRELVERHQAKVVSNCRHITRSPNDSRDLAQEVFVKTYFGLRRFRRQASFKTWMFRIKANHCLNFLRKQRHVSTLQLDAPEAQAVPDQSRWGEADREAIDGSERERIDTVLESMPDAYRIPLILSDMDGLSTREVAEELGIGHSAVKMRIMRGREQFRALFAELIEATSARGGENG